MQNNFVIYYHERVVKEMVKAKVAVQDVVKVAVAPRVHPPTTTVRAYVLPLVIIYLITIKKVLHTR